jgi:hypothetical protein
MKSKCITRHPDYNCCVIADECVYLIGGKFDNTEPQRVKLPFRVNVGWGSKLHRHWLNKNCEGWYDYNKSNGCCWFERDSDALTVLMVWG